MLKNAKQEVDYRLAKWLLRNMEKQGLLDPAELREIWSELITVYLPPTQSIEVVSDTIRGDRNA